MRLLGKQTAGTSLVWSSTLTKKQEKGKATFYKIIEHGSKIITVSKISSGLLTDTFMAKEKAKFHEKNLERAYKAEIPQKAAKANGIEKYLS